jgi:hypothetical protein
MDNQNSRTTAVAVKDKKSMRDPSIQQEFT